MPFTFAHPAIILPLLKKYRRLFSTTGLVVGSIAPDFECFITLGGPKVYGHTWVGMVWFDLPLALLLATVFHLAIKKPLIGHLPASWQARCQYGQQFSWLQYLRQNANKVMFSLLLGIFSHLLWDAFTHLNCYYPDAITSNVKFMGKRVYIILQYLSSAIGLAVVGRYLQQLPTVNSGSTTSGGKWFWPAIAAIATIIFAARFYTLQKDTYVDAIFVLNVVLASLMYGLMVVCGWFTIGGFYTI